MFDFLKKKAKRETPIEGWRTYAFKKVETHEEYDRLLNQGCILYQDPDDLAMMDTVRGLIKMILQAIEHPAEILLESNMSISIQPHPPGKED